MDNNRNNLQYNEFCYILIQIVDPSFSVLDYNHISVKIKN